MSSENKSAVGSLFSLLWSVVTGLYRVAVLLLLLGVGVALWLGLRQSAPPRLESNLALVIYPTGQLVDTADADPTQRFLEEFSGAVPAQSVLREMVQALGNGAKDPRITLAVLKLDGLWGSGVAQMQELAAAVSEFRASGKPVYAHGPYFYQNDYLVAAHSDRVSMDPLGLVFLNGFGHFQNYYKEALDKLEVDVHVFRVGEFKSAVEPFERNDMSSEAREASGDWLGDLWQAYGHQLAQARKLPETAAHDYVLDLPSGLEAVGGNGAALAQSSGLIDAIETQQEFREQVAKLVNWDENHGSFRQVHYTEYLRAVERENGIAGPRDARRKVALVVVQGEIVDGESEPGLAGAETIANLLAGVREDEDVAAVVLRVDSPGGSVFGSERIRRELRAIQADNVPVVASMSNVAASGGYWVAMDADEIWAHDTTVTGSIGIFGLWPTLDRSLRKLGIHTDGVGTTPLAGAFRLDRPLSPELAVVIRSQLEQGYRQFIEGVATGRDLPVEKVEEIARGRVWSGTDALRLGLVDQIGGLEQAVAAAVRLAGLEGDGYRVEEFRPPQEFGIGRLLDLFGQAGAMAPLQGWVAPWRAAEPIDALARSLRWLRDPRGLYSHCFCVPTALPRQR